MKRNKVMKSGILSRDPLRLLSMIGLAAFSCLLVLHAASATLAQGKQVTVVKAKTFATADEAAEALIAAAEQYDKDALLAILGPDSRDIIDTGEPAVDRETATEFVSQARAKKVISVDPRNRNRATLVIGNDSWPFPIPIVKRTGKWFFDTKAGRQEILYRRIGRNELAAMEICRGFVEAQHDYAFTKHEGSTVNQYAQRIISTSGKKDGLAWQNPDGTWGGSIGERAAKELEQSYTGKRSPFHGYYFKVLKGQGPAAPLGKLNYVIDGAMIGGFALLAYPAQYRVSGVKSFMISQDGVVYEKDLGPKTLQTAESIELFNPDKTWSPVLEDK